MRPGVSVAIASRIPSRRCAASLGAIPAVPRPPPGSAKSEYSRLQLPPSAGAIDAAINSGCSMKKRPTRSCRLPSPRGSLLRESSSRRAFSMPPVASTKPRARTRARAPSGATSRRPSHPLRIAIADQLDGVRVQQDPDVAGPRQLGAVLRAQAGRRLAPLPHPIHELGGVEAEHPARIPLEARRRVIERAQVEQLLGARVVPRERLDPDRPAAVRDPRPRREIQRGERSAEARPAVGRAAEEAHPRRAQIVGERARRLAAIQGLALGVDLEPPAFHHQHACAAPDELARERDPGGAGADDAEIGLDRVP